MTDTKKSRDRKRQDPAAPASPLRLKRLICNRTGRKIELREHERCPYCFGRLADIEKGQHEAFCDYRPGLDPVHFGFPADDRHFEQG